MAELFDRAGARTPTTGTGVLTLGSGLVFGETVNRADWQTFQAGGVTSGQAVRYLILDANGNWEYGIGTFTDTGDTTAPSIPTGLVAIPT